MRSITTALLLFAAVSLLACHAHPNPPELASPGADDGTKTTTFEFGGRTIFVVTGAKSGPPILLLHELPGMTSQCVSLAHVLAARGYTVYMPLMFGTPGKASTYKNMFKLLFTREFHVIADETSPIVKSLRELRDKIHTLQPSKKMGVIGMCITGNLPPAFLDRPYVQAAVMSQPALPTIGWGKESKMALSEADIKTAQASKVPILAFRFVTDTLSPEPRRQTFIRTFGFQITFRALCIEHPAHAVLTTELFDCPNHPKETGPSADALKELLGYLGRQLGP
jgi:dienelactone hydrolase